MPLMRFDYEGGRSMARLNLKAVEERVAPLAGRESYDREFVFELLLAYGKPQSSVTRLRNGDLNVAADPSSEVAQKKVVYFKETTGDPLEALEELKSTPDVVRFSTRFVIATDLVELVAHGTQTGETIGFPIREIDQHFTFFLPWAGMEKAQYIAEAHADVKAAERMGKLFDELLHANPGLLEQPHGRHALNLFFTRLLFCFFAEDTGIFAENQFTNAVGSHTMADGSDTAAFLTDLFTALDTARPADKPNHLAAFPYVNGRLFTMSPDHVVPAFTKSAREELISAGKLIWREINPDIFGSMFQAIVTPGKRSDLGQHRRRTATPAPPSGAGRWRRCAGARRGSGPPRPSPGGGPGGRRASAWPSAYLGRGFRAADAVAGLAGVTHLGTA